MHDVRLDQVLRIVNHRGHKQPGLTAVIEAVKIFVYGCVGTIRHAILPQVARPHASCGHLEIAFRRSLVIPLPIVPGYPDAARGKVVLVLRSTLTHGPATTHSLDDGL